MNAHRINSYEQEIRGRWVIRQGNVQGDEICRRIDDLIRDHLRPIGPDGSGWDHLYLDPDDDRYWELTYPESELHGGGPPCLKCLSKEQVRVKYAHLFS